MHDSYLCAITALLTHGIPMLQVNRGFADMSSKIGPLVQKPTKELLNLTTSVDNMVFSQDSQVGVHRCIATSVGCTMLP